MLMVRNMMLRIRCCCSFLRWLNSGVFVSFGGVGLSMVCFGGGNWVMVVVFLVFSFDVWVLVVFVGYLYDGFVDYWCICYWVDYGVELV